MIKRRLNSCFFWFKTSNRAMVTCTAPLDPPASVSTSRNDHKSLCFSLANNLLWRGRLSSAQQVVQRIIDNSATVPDAISAMDFAAGRGMELSVSIYGAFIRKLVELDEFKFAYTLYYENIVGRGIHPNSSIIISMVICLVKLRKLDDAMILFDKLVESGNGACNSFIRELCEREMFLEAFDCFVRIRNANMQLGIRCYNVLIDGLCCKGRLGEAMEVFYAMREKTGLLPTLHNYKSLFYGFCKGGWVMEAESICGEMEAEGFFVNKIMYTSLMNAYFKDKNIKMAMRVYMRMLKMGWDPDTFSCTALIQGHFAMGYFSKGCMMYNQMNESRVPPDAVTYHIMISNYCKMGKLDCATLLLNNMSHCNVAPSVHSYSALMAALYKDHRLGEVDELFKNMLNLGVIPDHVLFLVLLKNSLRGNELQLSLLMLQVILKHGCGSDPPLPLGPTMNLEHEVELLLEKIVSSNLTLANVAFQIYITALCEVGKIGAALACFRKMIGVGCRPLPFTFNSLVKSFFQDGHTVSFECLVDIMQEWDMIPDLSTYLIMVNELCKQNDLASAFHIMNQMEERGLKPSVAIYNSILSCLSREKRMFDSETLFQRMLETGVDPDETVYITMINGYCRSGRSLEAQQLFERMIKNSIQPSSHAYTALVSGLVKNNMIDEGCMYLHRMLEDGFVPNVVLYTSFVCHFLQKGDIEFAFRLVDLMERSKIEFDVIFYITLVSGVCRNITSIKKRWCKTTRAYGRSREMLFELLYQRAFFPRKAILRFSANSPEEMKAFALKLMHKIKETSFMPHLYLYNCIIHGFCCIDRIKDANSQFELMQREGICPNKVTFTILIGAHSRVGEIDRAIELFNLMNANGHKPDKFTYSILLRGLCKAGRDIGALSLFFAGHKMGFFPDKVSYENLLRCFCVCYLSTPAFKIFEEMLAHNFMPRQYSTKWLFCILCKEKKFHEAHMVLDLLSKNGKFPNGLARRLLV